MVESKEFEFQRSLAGRCNNAAWDLIERARSTKEDVEMLGLAHTAAYHWNQIGSEIQKRRAKILVALAHGVLGHGVEARVLAGELVEDRDGRNDIPDWEEAQIEIVMAFATHAMSDFAGFVQARHAAEARVAAIMDDTEREIVARLLRRLPAG